MPDRPVIRLTIAHDYHAPAEPPVRVVASQGLALRRIATGFAVILPDWQDQPGRISLTVLWNDLDLCSVTQGYDWTAVPVLEARPDRDTVTFGSDPILRTERRGPGDRRIMILEIDVDGESARDIQLQFHAVTAHWLYHLTGRGLRGDLQIIDEGDSVRFDDLGPEMLPNGAPAHAMRSATPLPLRARPEQRFALQYEGQFGPVVVIPALPAAGTRLRPLEGDRTSAGLQADIYVTLS